MSEPYHVGPAKGGAMSQSKDVITIELTWTTVTLKDGRVTWTSKATIPGGKAGEDAVQIMVSRRAVHRRAELERTEMILDAMAAKGRDEVE